MAVLPGFPIKKPNKPKKPPEKKKAPTPPPVNWAPRPTVGPPTPKKEEPKKPPVIWNPRPKPQGPPTPEKKKEQPFFLSGKPKPVPAANVTSGNTSGTKKNTKKKIEKPHTHPRTPQASTSPAPSAAPTASTGDGKKPRTPIVKGKGKGKGKGPKPPTGGSKGPVTDTHDDHTDDPLAAIFDPAFGEIEKSKSQAEVDRVGWLSDIDAYIKAAAEKEAAGREWAKSMWDENAKTADAGTAKYDANLAATDAATTAVSGGNADLERISGIDTAQAIQAAQAPADAAAKEQARRAREALSNIMLGTDKALTAQAGDMRSQAQSIYNARARALDTARSGLVVDKGKMGVDMENNRAKQALDERMYNLMAGEKASQQEIDAYKAKTDRMQVLTTAAVARERMRLEEKIAAGDLDVKKAKQNLDVWAKEAGLTVDQRKLELKKLELSAKQTQGATTFLNTQYESKYGPKGTRKWDKDRGADRQFVRDMIGQLGAQYGNTLTRFQAIAAINGRFPGALEVRPNDRYPLINQLDVFWPPPKKR